MKITIAPSVLMNDPESLAMMQAFYSRSLTGIEERLADLAEAGADKAESIRESLAKWYIGYGHESIGQTAFVPVFIEGVSLVVAKAIQAHPLYTGQESSTRYIDFRNNPVVTADPEDQELVTELLALYEQAVPAVLSSVMDYNDVQETAAKNVITACAARTFDICRSILPWGVTTNLSCVVSFSTWNEILHNLWNSVLPGDEPQRVALAIHNQLVAKFPKAIKPLETSLKTKEYHLKNQAWLAKVSSYADTNGAGRMLEGRLFSLIPPVDKDEPIPLQEADSMYRFIAMIDGGSWRDVQRHRTLNPSPLFHSQFTSSGGLQVHHWYASGLPQHLVAQLYELMGRSRNIYTLPLGALMPIVLQGRLANWRYFCRLRSGETVHPTAQALARAAQNQLGSKVTLASYGFTAQGHSTIDALEIAIKRGSQTIEKRD